MLTLYLPLHCTTHTYTIDTRANYNTYNTISNNLIRLQLANLQFLIKFYNALTKDWTYIA